MTLSRLVLVPSVILTLAACASGGRSTPTPTVGPTSPPAQATSSPGAPTAGAQSIEVALIDGMRIEPATMSATAGEPVTFVVTNTGAIEHEFFLGDEAEQAAHEVEMAEMGGMAHDEPNGIAVEPGETKELAFTFASAGEWIAGCHVPGHYPAGMKATITVTD